MTEEKAVVVKDNTLAIVSDIQIDMEALVSVGLSRMENSFTAKIKTLQDKVSNTKAAIKELLKRNDEIREASSPASMSTLKETLNAADLLTGHVEIITKYDNTNKFNISTLRSSNATNQNGYRLSVIFKKESVPLTDEQTRNFDSVDSKYKEVDDDSREIIKIRRRMSNIGSLERKIKSRIVEKQMSKSVEGQELLDSFLEGFEADMEAME